MRRHTRCHLVDSIASGVAELNSMRHADCARTGSSMVMLLDPQQFFTFYTPLMKVRAETSDTVVFSAVLYALAE